MPLINTYTDGYIATQITNEREARAMADVADLGTLPAAWVTRLTVLRAYVITCLECAKSTDDMWTAKFSSYSKEYTGTLQQARAAQSLIDAASTTPGFGTGVFTCEIARG
jgi:hypothetical protein